MSEKKLSAKLSGLRTWVEIDSNAAHHNYKTFRRLIGPKIKLWAVVKSNAYGHGLVLFSKLADSFGADGFCVDSIIEGNRLRQEGVTKPILILGPTLPARLRDAEENGITVSVSNTDALKAIICAKPHPAFHIKVDTGFHRQGFYVEDIPKAIALIQNSKSKIKNSFKGVFTHFAAAKDVTYPTYTEMQFGKFELALRMFRDAGFDSLTVHAAATGATTLNAKYHMDAVRVGMGLYGFHASPELEMQLPYSALKPVLHWKTVVSEVKKFNVGDYVGYDITERMRHSGMMAVLPIGYWHGFPRAFSSIGEVLIGGSVARVIGRVSMDLTVVDVTGIKCKPGMAVVVIGKSGKEEIRAQETARIIGTTQYELLTRLNPLMERIIV
ncbi:MAG: alanine racemase [Patescibacteria group bacterium]|nr:alanine racemase [Patescibacteria group bacterium]